MFEQALLEGSYGNRRAFAAGAGFAGQAALAAFIVIAPMIWPQAMPAPQFMISLAPPPPIPAPPDHTAAVRPRTRHGPMTIFRLDLSIPARMPAHPQTVIDDVEPGVPASFGVEGGTGAASDFVSRLLNSGAVAVKPEVKPRDPKAPVDQVKQVRVSSLDPGRLIHQVEPVYPPIAKTAHISGTVELRAVIGTDGRIRELNVTSGPMLLRKAALDAVSQWVYKPTVLNGVTVEVIAPIAVIFRLN
jgi:periplasmic protein TonB